MESSAITFIMNGKTYRISAADGDAIRQISKQDRTQLIDLLEAVKLQDRLAAAAVQQAAVKAGVTGTGSASTNTVPEYQQVKPERLSSGDVDDLMARLIMEEKKNKKPGLTQQTIYKWAAGIIALVFLLVLFF